jgi:hypothetical protein
VDRDGGGNLRADPPSRGSRPTNAATCVRQRASAVLRASVLLALVVWGIARATSTQRASANAFRAASYLARFALMRRPTTSVFKIGGGGSLDRRFCPNNCPGAPSAGRAKGKQRVDLFGDVLVGVAGFEPATPSSRTRCATSIFSVYRRF